MKKALLSIALIMAIGSYSAKAQVNIGSTNPPDASAALQVSSTNQGIRFPQVSLSTTTTFGLNAPTAASAAVGMIVFNTNNNITSTNSIYPALASGLYTWDGTGWRSNSDRIVFAAQGSTRTTAALNVTSANIPLAPLLTNSIFLSFNATTNSITIQQAGVYMVEYQAVSVPTAAPGSASMIATISVSVNGAAAQNSYNTIPANASSKNIAFINGRKAYIHAFNAGDVITFNGGSIGTSGYGPINYFMNFASVSKMQ